MLDVLAFDVRFRSGDILGIFGRIPRAHDPRYVCRNINSIRQNISLAYGGRYVGLDARASIPAGGQPAAVGRAMREWMDWFFIPGCHGFREEAFWLVCWARVTSQQLECLSNGQTDFHSWLSWSPRGGFLACMQG